MFSISIARNVYKFPSAPGLPVGQSLGLNKGYSGSELGWDSRKLYCRDVGVRRPYIYCCELSSEIYGQLRAPE